MALVAEFLTKQGVRFEGVMNTKTLIYLIVHPLPSSEHVSSLSAKLQSNDAMFMKADLVLIRTILCFRCGTTPIFCT